MDTGLGVGVVTPTDECTMSIFSSVVVGELFNTIVPELYSIFGMDAIKFIEIFSGMQIEVPDKSQIKNCVIKAIIYRLFVIDRLPIQEISLRYGVEPDKINRIVAKVNKHMESFPFHIKKIKEANNEVGKG